MNVFEDLIVELKEENLLEKTVIDTDPPKKADVKRSKRLKEPVDGDQPPSGEQDETPGDIVSDEPDPVDEPQEIEIEIERAADPPPAVQQPSPARKPKAGKEFFKKRAVDEVSSHQMVEHVLTGVEREYMKVVPKTFDDFNAKKALHTFLNIAENSNSEEHKTAEFALMQETETWGMALIERDSNIAVSNIRQYCENSRPALSSQALLALARFYRNAPYSESVRAKFDFVITRLFSRPVEFDKRVCLFARDEMVGHINTLYSEWSSIPLYAADDDDESNILLTGLSFDDLAAEAESAANFDQLIASDFFGRLRLFKESISELFYAPSVTSAAIESNIRIGNAYVSLIVRERQKLDSASIQSKYGDFNGQSVSDATGRTLDIVELLSGITDEALAREAASVSDAEAAVEPGMRYVSVTDTGSATSKAGPPFVERILDGVRSVNRWILGVGLVLILVTGGLYLWSAYAVEEKVSTAGVTDVELESSFLKEHIKTGRISGEIFYGLLLPSWDVLPKEKRQEFLQKVYQAGAEKGWKQVNLIGKDGKMAGFASPTRIEVIMP